MKAKLKEYQKKINVVECNEQSLCDDRKRLVKQLEDMRKTVEESEILKVSICFVLYAIEISPSRTCTCKVFCYIAPTDTQADLECCKHMGRRAKRPLLLQKDQYL